jgi:NADPH:quinone reductase-like Zn-dependent oxidoreductase
MEQWTTLMDGIDNLKLETVPKPTEIGPNEVLVKISHVSLNYRDAKSMLFLPFRHLRYAALACR